MNLVIVESPSKAKTIVKYLGKDFKIMASVGHLIDLPKKTLGVDIENNFLPEYEIMEGRKKIIADIKREASKADAVYLATDPDREGEAIAWHIASCIKNKKIHRVYFYEITKNGVQTAIKNPLDINMDMVNAQQSRRILDRLVGYKVSPLLWKPLKYGLSAGRVQSVALKMVAIRQSEINSFVPVESWNITVDTDAFEDKNNKKKKLGSILFTLDKYKNKKIKVKKEKEAKAIETKLGENSLIIKAVEKKQIKRQAQPAFITATLQQDAISRFGYSSKKVMSIAQKLYEGMEIDGEYSGLITYMRTDSTRIASEAVASGLSYIKSTFGDKYAGKPKFKKSSSSQDAHEAIRPTNVENTPEKMKKSLTNEQYKVYNLIWKRFVASLMADALFDNVVILADSGDYELRSSSSVLKFDGYKAVYMPSGEDKTDNNALRVVVTTDNGLAIKEIKKEQHFTKPPSKYSEASLVKEMEKNGIGRPSTYSNIISTLMDRGYIELLEKRFNITELGLTVDRLLDVNFKQLFEIDFTANMEKQLDDIAAGKLSWGDVLKQFYVGFEKELKKAEKSFKSDLSVVDIKCPSCASTLAIKNGKQGMFIACSNYPECKFTSDFKRDDTGKIQLVEREESTETFGKCDKCDKGDLVIKKSRNGEFIGCSNYPECKNIKSFLRGQDNEVIMIELDKKVGECSKDSGDMVVKSGRNGVFAACSNYPKCKSTASLALDESNNLVISQKSKSDIVSDEKCEKCDSDMVVKYYRGRSFLACSNYPTCKNTKSIKAK